MWQRGTTCCIAGNITDRELVKQQPHKKMCGCRFMVNCRCAEWLGSTHVLQGCVVDLAGADVKPRSCRSPSQWMNEWGWRGDERDCRGKGGGGSGPPSLMCPSTMIGALVCRRRCTCICPGTWMGGIRGGINICSKGHTGGLSRQRGMLESEARGGWALRSRRARSRRGGEREIAGSGD